MSEREVDTITGEIRGVRVRWDRVRVAGHIVEMTLAYRIAEAEQVYGKRWDDELDRHLQRGMFAMDRISADGTMGKAAAAEARVVDGVCRRTVRIGNCEDVAPMYSCVPGTPPIDHATLAAHDEPRPTGEIGRDAAG